MRRDDLLERLLLRQASSLEFTGTSDAVEGFALLVTRDVAEAADREGAFVFVRHFGRCLHADATKDEIALRPKILVTRGEEFAWWPWHRDRPAVDDDWCVYTVDDLRKAASFAISLCDGDVDVDEADEHKGDCCAER